MKYSLTKQTRTVLALSNESAQKFNHDYVGTEHLLLGLMDEGSEEIKGIMSTFGLNAELIRSKIDSLVQPGLEASKSPKLTPRALAALQYANNEAQLMDEKCVRPEHILLGLIHEEAGVACQVLLSLGISPSDLRKEVFNERLAQMKRVERIVRPIRASTPRKRKMREELLSHFSAICDQERRHTGDSSTVLRRAESRFGNPADLSRDLQASLPRSERLSFLIERLFGWRAPESAPRYAIRQAFLTFLILTVTFSLVWAGVFLRYGWLDSRQLARVFASLVVIVPPAQFAITLLALKMRNSIWGVFGSQRSIRNVLSCVLATAAVISLSLCGISWISQSSLNTALESMAFCVIVGILGASVLSLLVRLLGEAAIRDTLWATLDVDAA